MDKEKLPRKKSLGSRRASLPAPPPEPSQSDISPSNSTIMSSGQITQIPSSTQSTKSKDTQHTQHQDHPHHHHHHHHPHIPEAIKHLLGYKDREKHILKNIHEKCGDRLSDPTELSKNLSNPNIEIDSQNQISSTRDQNIEMDCRSFILPLLNRTGPSVSAALASIDAIDQLDKLHNLCLQFLSWHEQTNRMQQNIRNIKLIHGLKEIQNKFTNLSESGEISDDYSDNEALEAEIAQNEKLWDTILAAGRSATNKRLNSKRSRTKTLLTEGIDLSFLANSNESNKPYPLRRQSAITDFKAKVSKWTKVKAAFKWEKANAATFHEGKSTDSGIGLTPNNNEIARYLRVPSVPCAGSSADSVMSSSSGHMLSSGSVPPSPGTISPASSMEDVYHMSEDIHSEELSSGDFSEPTSPDLKEHQLALQKLDIKKNYQELQKRLNHEFEQKQIEFYKIRSASAQATQTSLSNTSSTSNILCDKIGKYDPSIKNSMAEDNLSAEFKKKLHEWRMKKQHTLPVGKDVPITSTPISTPTTNSGTCSTNQKVIISSQQDKKIDWNLWKTGQIKLEGQGLIQMPDEKDLPEDFQKKLDEWKRMKTSNYKSSSYNSDSSLKRQSSKSDYSGGKTTFGSHSTGMGSGDSSHSNKKFDFDKELQKIKRAQQRERQAKAKSAEHEKLEKIKIKKVPAKEVTVQTTEGVIKFEGISRKFTRKLYEWEKSRGIGPESSTFALLHPGYRPLAVGNINLRDKETREKSPCLTRSFSMDSISPIPSISHQTSSLSLNDADELKGSATAIDRRISSNPELEINDSEVPDEPEAVIVEVEDEIEETAAPLISVPSKVERQTAVYKYEHSSKGICIPESKNSFLNEPQEENQTIDSLKKSVKILDDYIKGHEDLRVLKAHIKQIFGLFNEIPIHVRRINSKGYDEIKDFNLKIINNLAQHNEADSAAIHKDVKEFKEMIQKYIKGLSQHLIKEKDDDVPIISVTPASVTTSSHLSDSEIHSIAKVSYTPEIKQHAVRVHQVQIMHDLKKEQKEINSSSISNISIQKSKDIENVSQKKESPKLTKIPEKSIEFPNSSHKITRTQSMEDENSRKITRTSSNGAKRKVKVRRMGSRQSSKTETESDDDTQNFVLETPRKCKRKTSRAKKPNIEPEKVSAPDSSLTLTPSSENTVVKPTITSTPSQQNEDIVYVLKIKRPSLSEMKELKPELMKSIDSNVLISTNETCVELIEGSSENLNSSTTASVFVKTKRKIFSPVDDQKGNTNAVIGHELENSSASEKNEIDDLKKSMIDEKKIKNLPPLPQSPSTQRKSDLSEKFLKNSGISKELSPSIRMMIAKYNQRLSAERSNTSPMSSGSCSPIAWRSPVLDRRVRIQSLKYQEKVFGITKSSSAGNLEKSSKNIKHLEKSNSCNENDHECDLIRSVKKSLSAGRLENQWQVVDIFENIDKEIQGDDDKKKDNENKENEQVKENIAPEYAVNQIVKPARRFKRNTEKHHSAPVSPGTEESPKTPLSERALKLLKAKEEFFNPIRNVVKNRDHWANRLSQISMNSEVVQNDGMLMKSASVGILGSPKQDNQHPSGYTSLPRNTKSPTSTDNEGKESSNESKNRNRFGLSNIASKLRKVKLRRSSKDLTKMNVVSTLCRQSLMVDITGAVKNPTVTGFPGHSDSEDSTRTVRPVSSESSLTGGQSIPTTSISSSQSGFTLRFRNKTRNVKKSKSTNIVDENLK